MNALAVGLLISFAVCNSSYANFEEKKSYFVFRVLKMHSAINAHKVLSGFFIFPSCPSLFFRFTILPLHSQTLSAYLIDPLFCPLPSFLDIIS